MPAHLLNNLQNEAQEDAAGGRHNRGGLEPLLPGPEFCLGLFCSLSQVEGGGHIGWMRGCLLHYFCVITFQERLFEIRVVSAWQISLLSHSQVNFSVISIASPLFCKQPLMTCRNIDRPGMGRLCILTF